MELQQAFNLGVSDGHADHFAWPQEPLDVQDAYVQGWYSVEHPTPPVDLTRILASDEDSLRHSVLRSRGVHHGHY
jgi:hypothetical protein